MIDAPTAEGVELTETLVPDWLPELSCGRCIFYAETEPPNLDAPEPDTGIFEGRGECLVERPQIIFDVTTGKREHLLPEVSALHYCKDFALYWHPKKGFHCDHTYTEETDDD